MWGIAFLFAAFAAPGAAAPPSVCEGAPAQSAGALDVRLGEPFAAAMARSTYRFRPDFPPTGLHSSGERLDLRFRDGERLLDLPGIGGTYNTALEVTEILGGATIGLIGFNYQDRPLTVAEALDRAIMLRRWFVEGGFRALPQLRGVRDSRGFRIANAPNALAAPGDRAVAETMLANERRAIPAMTLFRLRRGGQQVDVSLENWRRVTVITGGGGADAFNACHGREWGLHIYLTTS